MTSIAGIGYNPLGDIGLGMSGQFGSYDAFMPSMMGMGYGMGMTNPMFGMGGMMSSYPQYLAQMQQTQNMIEASQAKHNGAMHNILLNNEVNAYGETDSALIQKMLQNGDVKQGILRLQEKVEEGDQDGICKEFDELKKYVSNTYSKEISSRGNNINPDTSVVEIITNLYSQIDSTQKGKTRDLITEIRQYGDNAFENGFMSGFKRGHHTRYVDETLNHCFGLSIDQREAKDTNELIGNALGRTASVIQKGAYGAAAGAGAYSLLNLGTKGLGALVGCKVPFKWRGVGWGALFGALAGVAADIWWQSGKA